jgi:hypothetical protein
MSTSGTLEDPGWLVPSITTGTVMLGSADKSEIVCAPLPMLKPIVLGPGVAESESRIACRSDPVPESAVVLTKKDINRRCSRSRKCGRNGSRFRRVRPSR